MVNTYIAIYTSMSSRIWSMDVSMLVWSISCAGGRDEPRMDAAGGRAGESPRLQARFYFLAHLFRRLFI